MTDRPPDSPARGHCLCGAVRYEVHGPLRPVVYCHCEMCRRTSGHYVAATACARHALSILSSDMLGWYQSSPKARRGFCKQCGSNLFWDAKDASSISIWAGTLDSPTGLEASMHIYTADAGDYYGIHDGLPQHAGWPV